VLVTAAALAAPASGQVHLTKLVGSDTAAPDRFGLSVARRAELAVVGAPRDEDAGPQSGSAYVFMRAGGLADWAQVKKLVAPGAAAGDFFGSAVAIGADVVLVGAPGDDGAGDAAGAVHVFARDEGGPGNWGFVLEITAGDAAPQSAFGSAIAIGGASGAEFAIIGAPEDDALGVNAGAAYVVARNKGGAGAWGEVTKITAQGATGTEFFGASVAVDGDRALIGATLEDFIGAAYLHERNLGGPDAWGFTARLDPAIPAFLGSFGATVSIDGDAAVVGAPGTQFCCTAEGAAHVFARDEGGPDNWGEVVRLVGVTPRNDQFGISVLVRGGLALVGAQLEDLCGLDAGALLLFARDNPSADEWGDSGLVSAFDASAQASFGGALAEDGGLLLVGAPGNTSGTVPGAAYLIDVSAVMLGSAALADCNGNGTADLVDLFVSGTSADCNDNAVPDECDVASGTSADANGNGIPDECEPAPACPGDVDGDGDVDFADLLQVLAGWGVCP
jgi:hypothetical protein